jgi:hypothetical protein
MWLVTRRARAGSEAERREERCRRQASAQRSGWLAVSAPSSPHRQATVADGSAHASESTNTHFHASGGPALHMDR